jgi:hypothetical protein
MSLAGSLDDLGLGDLLQILSLAGRSGLLTLQASEGEGWVLFVAGNVAGAMAKGGAPDLTALLREHGGVASAHDSQQIEEWRGDATEQAVLRMLGWLEGDFRFDVGGGEEWARASGLCLEVPIPSQYLAMEGVRLRDEAGPGAASGSEDAAAQPSPAPASVHTPPAPASVEPKVAPAAGRLPNPLVVIDPERGALDWLKAWLSESFLHVHVFQDTELGVARIRQYLGRGEQPAVLLARDARPDPLSGVRDGAELVSRLALQAPRMPIVLLVERDGPPIPLRTPAVPGLTGVVTRPSVGRLRSLSPKAQAQGQEAGAALRTALVALIREAWTA